MSEDIKPTVDVLANIRIVLVETSHTGNVGSAARAMKTMGLSQLYLVNPLVKPDSQSIAMAAGASEIIEHAKLVNSLDQAIEGCHLVIGTSARSRTLPWPMLQPDDSGLALVKSAHQAPVALVFGRERVGLTNEELQKCHYHVMIPANPIYSSLNLAMAVQVLSYEIRKAWLAVTQLDKAMPEAEHYPLAEDLERFYQHLEHILIKTEFIRTATPGPIMGRLRRLFTRARPENQELNILRGILASIEAAIQNRSSTK